MQHEGWPPLTASELLILHNPNTDYGEIAFKLVLMELLGQRVLELYPDPKDKPYADRLVLVPPTPGQPPRPPLQRLVLEILTSAGPDPESATVAQVVARARQMFGENMARFRDIYIIPALTARGLLDTRLERRLWIFTETCHYRTVAGEKTLEEAQRLMAKARSLPGLRQPSGAPALALALQVGGALLLMDALYMIWGSLSEDLRRSATAAKGSYDGVLPWSAEAGDNDPSDVLHRLSTLEVSVAGGGYDYGGDSGGGDSGGWGGGGGDGGGGGW